MFSIQNSSATQFERRQTLDRITPWNTQWGVNFRTCITFMTVCRDRWALGHQKRGSRSYAKRFTTAKWAKQRDIKANIHLGGGKLSEAVSCGLFILKHPVQKWPRNAIPDKGNLHPYRTNILICLVGEIWIWTLDVYSCGKTLVWFTVASGAAQLTPPHVK